MADPAFDRPNPAPSLARARAKLAGERRTADARRTRFLTGWGALTFTVLLLYVFIGNRPWAHGFVLDPSTGGTAMSPVNRYIWLALLALASPLLWLQRERLLNQAKAIWPLLFLFAWFGLSTTWALDHAASNRRFILYLIDLAICMGLGGALSQERAAHAVMARACLLIILIDLGSWIVAPQVSMTDLGLAAIHNHKNTLGVVMLFCGVVIATYLPGRSSWVERAVYGAALAGGFVLMVASQSKTSLGILVGFLALIPLAIWVLRQPPLLAAGVSSLGLLVLLGGIQAWTIWGRLQAQDPFAFIDHLTFTERRDVWRYVVGEALKSPWRGVGFSSFWDIDPRLQPSLKSGLWFAQPDSPTNEAHDGYLDLWVTTGVVGLGLALLVLFRWISRGLWLARQALRRDPALSPATCHRIFLAALPLVILSHNFLESSLFNSSTLFGLLGLYAGIDIDLRFQAERRGPHERDASGKAGV